MRNRKFPARKSSSRINIFSIFQEASNGKTIERLVNGNIKVTIPIRMKYDGSKTVINQPEAEITELDPETMSPLQKAVIQGFQYRDMLESGKVATVSELAQKVKQERAFLS